MQQQSDFSLDVWLLKGVLFLALAALIVVSLPLWLPLGLLRITAQELRSAWSRGPFRFLGLFLFSLPLVLFGCLLPLGLVIGAVVERL